MRIRQIASTATPVLWQPMPAPSGISHLLLNQIRLKLPEDWTNVQIYRRRQGERQDVSPPILAAATPAQ